MSRSAPASGRSTASRIDWAQVHRRLEAAAVAGARGNTPTAEEKETVLRARAAALARPNDPGVRADDQLEVLEFQLGHERYAIASSLVREVYPLKDMTPLPGTPPFVRGIVNLRGRIVSVIDLKRFFDLPEQGLTDLNRVIVIGEGVAEFGLLADAVVGVRSLLRTQVQPSLPTLTGVRAAYLAGVTGERLIVLDGAAILADPKVIVRDETKS